MGCNVVISIQYHTKNYVRLTIKNPAINLDRGFVWWFFAEIFCIQKPTPGCFFESSCQKNKEVLKRKMLITDVEIHSWQIGLWRLFVKIDQKRMYWAENAQKTYDVISNIIKCQDFVCLHFWKSCWAI